MGPRDYSCGETPPEPAGENACATWRGPLAGGF